MNLQRPAAALSLLAACALTLPGAFAQTTKPAAKPVTGKIAALRPLKLIDVPVHEGTSMSVAVSPDGGTLAVDLQGAIYTMPSTGGTLKRITGLFDDARQPVFSPDGKWITCFAYLDGGYDLWTMHPDGSDLHKLTWGPFDDREPAYSHDGRYIAFASDRDNPLGSSYNIWKLDLQTGEITRVTNDPSENHMPSWSPDDKEIAFSSTREDGASIWAVNVESGKTHKVETSADALVSAPSWGPGGKIVYNAQAPGKSRLFVDGKPLTGDENAFAFRASWASPTDFYYVSDGKVRKRSVKGGDAQTVEFTAVLQVTRAFGTYKRYKRDFESTAPRKVLGIVRPVISPDGKNVAFAAVGDIWVMPVGGKPVNITKDRYLDTDPAWSPDGKMLVYSSDKGRDHLQLWLHDMANGTDSSSDRELTHLASQPQGASFSPDGKRVAFFDVTTIWRAAEISTVDIATGKVTVVHSLLNQPGMPTWSPDGTRLALANIAPYSKTVREGTNQVFTFSSTNGAEHSDDKWFQPIENLGMDSRGFCGPVWSPDGMKMAGIYEGVLAVWPVAKDGTPLGPPHHVTSEIAYSPSWMGDSEHILYQSLDKLKMIDIITGEVKEIPLDLTYTPSVPKGHMIIHVGKLVDNIHETARENMDIVVDGNIIKAVRPHSSVVPAGYKLIDVPQYVAMPGLIEAHSHFQKDFGEAIDRSWLSWGITSVRSPGNTPYEGVEDIEANESGVRPGPRKFGTGYLMEWQRTYYKMGIAISSPAHLEMELQLAKTIHFDMLKSYVRMPDLQEKRIVEFAHTEMGVPVSGHEIYPAAYMGQDATEHEGATSRRGYSPKIATLGRAYEDVIQLFGQSQRYFTPTVSPFGTEKLLAEDPNLKNDPRFGIYPDWLKQMSNGERNEFAAFRRGRGGAMASATLGPNAGNSGKFLMDAMKAGAKITAGVDTPNAFALHGELETYVTAGMTPFQALRAATVNTAEELNVNTGTIEPGKLADIVILDGNPLDDIKNAQKVKEVIANGRLYTLEDLINNNIHSDPAK